MLILLLSKFTSLGDIQNCYASSIMNIEAKTSEVTIYLNITQNPDCLGFSGSVEFVLDMKTSTTSLDLVQTRYKIFNYSEQYIIAFSSTQDLSEVTEASVQLKNMIHSTAIIVGKITLDSSLPTECFQQNILNLINNETVLELFMNPGCKFIFTFPIKRVQILNFGLEKLPQVNTSVFLDGFSDFDNALKIQFPQNISYSQIKNGFQSNTQVQIELVVDGIVYIVESFIQDLIGYDYNNYIEELQIIKTSTILLTQFYLNQAVMSQLELMQLNSIEIQLAIFKYNSWSYLFIKFEKISEIDKNFSFPCNQDCQDSFDDIITLQLNLIGVYQDKIQFISTQYIYEYLRSSFLSGQVDFPDGMIRITFQQAPWDPYGSLYAIDFAQISIHVFTTENLESSFNTDILQITTETQYLSVKCLSYECLSIKKLYRDNNMQHTIIDFTRKHARTSFDIIEIDYNNKSQITGYFWITLLVSILSAIIWCFFQLFSAKIFYRKPRKQRTKKISCDDIL